MSARIFQLNVSPGGVPKRAVAWADIGENGLSGDSVAHPKVHGGPTRAVCIYALERILALQKEGGSLFPGALGENITTVDLDWDLVLPGTKLALGDTLIETTKYAEPCATTWGYVCNDRTLFQQEHRPGWSRVYAKVITPGRLVPGMPVRIV